MIKKQPLSPSPTTITTKKQTNKKNKNKNNSNNYCFKFIFQILCFEIFSTNKRISFIIKPLVTCLKNNTCRSCSKQSNTRNKKMNRRCYIFNSPKNLYEVFIPEKQCELLIGVCKGFCERI